MNFYFFILCKKKNYLIAVRIKINLSPYDSDTDPHHPSPPPMKVFLQTYTRGFSRSMVLRQQSNSISFWAPLVVQVVMVVKNTVCHLQLPRKFDFN